MEVVFRGLIQLLGLGGLVEQAEVVPFTLDDLVPVVALHMGGERELGVGQQFQDVGGPFPPLPGCGSLLGYRCIRVGLVSDEVSDTSASRPPITTYAYKNRPPA